MHLVYRVRIKGFHYLRRPNQVVDCFKQRNEIDREILERPPTGQKQFDKLENVGRLLTIADDKSMGSQLTASMLHLFDITDGFERVGHQRIRLISKLEKP